MSGAGGKPDGFSLRRWSSRKHAARKAGDPADANGVAPKAAAPPSAHAPPAAQALATTLAGDAPASVAPLSLAPGQVVGDDAREGARQDAREDPQPVSPRSTTQAGNRNAHCPRSTR